MRGSMNSLQLEVGDISAEDDGAYQCVVGTRVGNSEAPVVLSPVTRFRAIGELFDCLLERDGAKQDFRSSEHPILSAVIILPA